MSNAKSTPSKHARVAEVELSSVSASEAYKAASISAREGQRGRKNWTAHQINFLIKGMKTYLPINKSSLGWKSVSDLVNNNQQSADEVVRSVKQCQLKYATELNKAKNGKAGNHTRSKTELSLLEIERFITTKAGRKIVHDGHKSTTVSASHKSVNEDVHEEESDFPDVDLSSEEVVQVIANTAENSLTGVKGATGKDEIIAQLQNEDVEAENGVNTNITGRAKNKHSLVSKQPAKRPKTAEPLLKTTTHNIAILPTTASDLEILTTVIETQNRLRGPMAIRAQQIEEILRQRAILMNYLTEKHSSRKNPPS
jgi:hypothetical protein